MVNPSAARRWNSKPSAGESPLDNPCKKLKVNPMDVPYEKLCKLVPNVTGVKATSKAMRSSDLRQKMIALTTIHTAREGTRKAITYAAFRRTEVPSFST